MTAIRRLAPILAADVAVIRVNASSGPRRQRGAVAPIGRHRSRSAGRALQVFGDDPDEVGGFALLA